jgi:hypothetical protein
LSPTRSTFGWLPAVFITFSIHASRSRPTAIASFVPERRAISFGVGSKACSDLPGGSTRITSSRSPAIRWVTS